LKHGVQFDAIGGPEHGPFGRPEWNTDWLSAAGIGEEVVVVEFAIPFTALGVPPPQPGDRWGLNVARQRVGEGKQSGTTEMTAWSVTYNSFHVPDRFGTLIF